MLALIGAVNGIAPVISPIIGGALTDPIGWKGIFCVLLGLGFLLLLGSLRFRESLPPEHRLATRWSDTFHSFRTTLSDRQFVYYVLQMAFAQGVLFAYIASRPFIVQQYYGFSPWHSAYVFAVNAIAIGMGAVLSCQIPASVRLYRYKLCRYGGNGHCGMYCPDGRLQFLYLRRLAFGLALLRRAHFHLYHHIGHGMPT